MLIGRSHSGAAQVRCLALRARHCEGETERVARPTSITTESALITRCRVLSHARRCTVLLEIGIPLPSCEAASPSSPLRPSMVVLTLMCGRAPLRRGSLPSSMACCAISTRASARRCLAVLWSAVPRGFGERLDSCLERRATNRIQPGVEPVHAARGLTEVQRAQLEVLFSLSLEALAVPADAGFIGQVAQVFQGKALGVTDPVLLIDVLPFLPDLLAEVTDHRRRLVADLAGAQRLSDPGQVAQLLAHAESIRRRGLGHLALRRHPGASALPGKKMIATRPGRRHDAAELALQPVDGGAQAARVDEIVVGFAIEIGDRGLERPEFDRHSDIIRTFVQMSIYAV